MRPARPATRKVSSLAFASLFALVGCAGGGSSGSSSAIVIPANAAPPAGEYYDIPNRVRFWLPPADADGQVVGRFSGTFRGREATGILLGSYEDDTFTGVWLDPDGSDTCEPTSDGYTRYGGIEMRAEDTALGWRAVGTSGDCEGPTSTRFIAIRE